MTRRVAITGIGLVNSCGMGKDALWESAIQGRTGIAKIEDDAFDVIANRHVGYVQDFQPAKYVANRKSLKVMCRDIQMAVVASYLAKDDAGLKPEDINADRSGTCIGAGLFGHVPDEMADSFRVALNGTTTFDMNRFGSEGMGQLFPLWLLKYLPNMPACHITIFHGLRGPSNTLTADSSGSASAIEEAARIIQRGTADLMFCGGAECSQNDGLLRYHTQGILKNGDPSDTTYPIFSKKSSGIVVGEGAGILILEELEHAKKRNAPIYAELASFYSAADSTKTKEDRLQHQIYAIRTALEKANIKADQVDNIHLSAKGVAEEDAEESEVIREVYGQVATKPQLVASKALTGFMGFASAPTEMGLACMEIQKKKMTPSLSYGDALLSGEFELSSESSQVSPTVVAVNHFEKGLSHHSMILKSLEGEA